MQTIQAKVSKRLLSKADRLFTGTLDGRVIEVLQNARRAGATEVSRLFQPLTPDGLGYRLHRIFIESRSWDNLGVGALPACR